MIPIHLFEIISLVPGYSYYSRRGFSPKAWSSPLSINLTFYGIKWWTVRSVIRITFPDEVSFSASGIYCKQLPFAISRNGFIRCPLCSMAYSLSFLSKLCLLPVDSICKERITILWVIEQTAGFYSVRFTLRLFKCAFLLGWSETVAGPTKFLSPFPQFLSSLLSLTW